jgi:hypothetical protein
LAWTAAAGTLGLGGYMVWINYQQSPMLAKEKIPGALASHVPSPSGRKKEASHRVITDITGEKVKFSSFFSLFIVRPLK